MASKKTGPVGVRNPKMRGHYHGRVQRERQGAPARPRRIGVADSPWTARFSPHGTRSGRARSASRQAHRSRRTVDQIDGEVEVVIRSVEPARTKPVESIFEFIRKLPPGTRTKEDIDRQIAEERDSWGDR